MSPVEVRTRRWKRVEYDKLIESCVFPPGERVELVGGELLVREPQGSRHFTAIRAVEDALRTAFGKGWDVRVQGPLALDEESEPEPDVAVVAGSFRDYANAHPSRAALIVEVSESSLLLDREHKAGAYARAGVADYWILNLVDEVLEVRREPTPDPAAPFGWRYGAIDVIPRGGTVAPLAAPQGVVRVSDLLPL
jgi:Uma2 family endonuclease